MMITLLALITFSSFELDIGELEIQGPSATVLYQGVYGAPMKARQAEIVRGELVLALKARGLTLQLAKRQHMLADDLAQQHALELELELGLETQSLARAKGLLAYHQGKPSALWKDHERVCRLYFGAAHAFHRSAKPRQRDAALLRMSACQEGPLKVLPYSQEALLTVWRKLRVSGASTLTLRGANAANRVYLDGVLLGSLPLQVSDIAAGEHQLLVVDGSGGTLRSFQLKAGQSSLLELPSSRPEFADLLLTTSEHSVLVAELRRSGQIEGIIVFNKARNGLLGLVYSARGAALVEARDAKSLATLLAAAAAKQAPLPAIGLRLKGLSLGAGVAQKGFNDLRARGARVDWQVSGRLTQNMVDYAAKVLGKSPQALRAKLQAGRQRGAWGSESGFWLSLLALRADLSPEIAPVAGLSLLRLQPVSALQNIWLTLGAELSFGGFAAQPAGSGWDPLLHPVDPITASEEGLSERIRLRGSGALAARGLLGLAWHKPSSPWSLGLLGQFGWRQINADLLHEQLVQGLESSAQLLRSTGEFTWDGGLVGARLLGLYRLGPWSVGGEFYFEQSEFKAVELDLLIPARSQVGGLSLLLGRRF
jgi:hypothetical protein